MTSKTVVFQKPCGCIEDTADTLEQFQQHLDRYPDLRWQILPARAAAHGSFWICGDCINGRHDHHVVNDHGDGTADCIDCQVTFDVTTGTTLNPCDMCGRSVPRRTRMAEGGIPLDLCNSCATEVAA